MWCIKRTFSQRIIQKNPLVPNKRWYFYLFIFYSHNTFCIYFYILIFIIDLNQNTGDFLRYSLIWCIFKIKNKCIRDWCGKFIWYPYFQVNFFVNVMNLSCAYFKNLPQRLLFEKSGNKNCDLPKISYNIICFTFLLHRVKKRN